MVQLSVAMVTTHDSVCVVVFTTFTDWKVVPMAIVPMGKISVYDCSVTTLGLRQFLPIVVVLSV